MTMNLLQIVCRRHEPDVHLYSSTPFLDLRKKFGGCFRMSYTTKIL